LALSVFSLRETFACDRGHTKVVHSINSGPRFFSVPRIHCREQPVAFDKPGLKIAVDVQHEGEILRFQISTDRGMMAGAGSEDFLAAEIDDVATAGLVGLAKVLLELVGREIAQHGDGTIGLRARDFRKFVKAQSHDAAGPATAGPCQNRAFGACRFAQRSQRICDAGGPAHRQVRLPRHFSLEG
jgi:hypothetical protein